MRHHCSTKRSRITIETDIYDRLLFRNKELEVENEQLRKKLDNLESINSHQSTEGEEKLA